MTDHKPSSIDTLIDQAYEAALVPEYWHDFVAGLARSLNGKSALLRVLNLDGARQVLSSYHYNLDESLQQSYIDGFVAQDPYLEALRALPSGCMVRNDNLIDLHKHQHTAFYQYYMRPLDNHFMIGGFVERSDRDLHTILGVHRHSGSEHFSDMELEIVQALAPHVKRAVRMGRNLGLAHLRASSAEQALEALNIASFLLAENGRLLHANAAGQQLLQAERVLRVQAGRLVPACHQDQSGFARIIEQVSHGVSSCRSAALRLRAKPGDNTHLIATVMPAPTTLPAYPGTRPSAAVYVADLDDLGLLRPETLTQLYGLTSAEARLAVGLARGAELSELSSTWHVSRETLRTQLKAVFAKTGVRRQSELVRLLAGAPWKLTHPPNEPVRASNPIGPKPANWD